MDKHIYCGLPGTMVPGPGGSRGLAGLGVFYNPGKLYSEDSSTIGYVVGYADISGNNIFDTMLEIPLINESMQPRSHDTFIYKNGTDIYIFTILIPENGADALSSENKKILQEKYPDLYNYIILSNYILLLKYQGKHSESTKAVNNGEIALELSSYPLKYNEWLGTYLSNYTKPNIDTNNITDYYVSVFTVFCGISTTEFNDMIIEAEFIPDEYDFNARTCRVNLWNTPPAEKNYSSEIYRNGYPENFNNKLNYDDEFPGVFKMSIKTQNDHLQPEETQYISVATFPKNILSNYSVTIYGYLKTNAENYKKIFLGHGKFADSI